jgi:hypothetical protein
MLCAWTLAHVVFFGAPRFNMPMMMLLTTAAAAQILEPRTTSEMQVAARANFRVPGREITDS